MNLLSTENKVELKDLESKLRDELNQGLPINWKLFVQIERLAVFNNAIYKRVVDLLLYLGVFSLDHKNNIILREHDPTSYRPIGNPKHYDDGRLFFTRERDAVEYIRAAEELNYFVKGYEAQRVITIK